MESLVFGLKIHIKKIQLIDKFRKLQLIDKVFFTIGFSCFTITVIKTSYGGELLVYLINLGLFLIITLLFPIVMSLLRRSTRNFLLAWSYWTTIILGIPLIWVTIGYYY